LQKTRSSTSYAFYWENTLSTKDDDNIVSFDPIWETIYQSGHEQRYPWDLVVSFVYRYTNKDIIRSDVQILEVGCGTGSNLWFAAREGFSTTGIDASETAIDHAKQRFIAEGLRGNFHVGSFTDLPFKDKSYDLIIDRAAITNCGLTAGSQAIQEIHRVLKPNGVFLFNPYAQEHSSRITGISGQDGVTINITGGTLTGVGQICFYDKNNIHQIFSDTWDLLSMRHLVMEDLCQPDHSIHSEWRVIARKIDQP